MSEEIRTKKELADYLSGKGAWALERFLEILEEETEKELAALRAENKALREVARGVTLLEDEDGGRTFPPRSLIAEARAALAQPNQPAEGR